MVRILNAANCVCGVCNGGDKVPPETYGGSWCPCRCHNKQEEAVALPTKESLETTPHRGQEGGGKGE